MERLELVIFFTMNPNLKDFFFGGAVCVCGGGGGLELVNFSFKESKSKKRFFIILGGRGARGSEFFKKESLSN